MRLDGLRYIAVLLAALAMGMHLAHALELAPKRAWDGALFQAVQGSLYVWFGRIGPVFEVGAFVAVAALAWRLRGSGPAARWTGISAALLAAALVAWAAVVLPAHAQIQSWSPAALPGDWTRWRDQWQFGQAGIFGLHLIGFSALIRGALAERGG
jgi:hypothetical protein